MLTGVAIDYPEILVKINRKTMSIRGGKQSRNCSGDSFIRAARGFTFIELLIVIAIAGILAALAAPSFSSFLKREKILAVSDELVSAIQVVRSAAIRSGVPVILCASGDGNSCGGQWSDGWFAFKDDDRDASPAATEQVVLRRKSQSSGPQISVSSLNGGSVNAVRFNYRGAPDSALSVLVTLDSESRSISVSPFGKPRHNE